MGFIYIRKKYHWTLCKIMSYQVSFCPFWNEDDQCLSHPRKLQEIFFDKMFFRRNVHLSQQLFSVWDQSHSICFNRDSCHHSQKSVFSRKWHIAVFVYVFIHIYTQTLVMKCVIFQISPHGIMTLKKKSAHEYGQTNRSDWGLSTRDFNRGVRNWDFRSIGWLIRKIPNQ